MSFWNLNDQSEKIETTGEFESGGGDIEPIPAKTQVKAAIDEAKWDDYEGEQFIKLRWNVLFPAEYKGRKIFQKVKVNESDTKKQDKAKKMLAAIAVNCGGGLLKLAKQPDDQDLQKHLMNKPMALLLQVWSIPKDDGSGKATGNWISAVSPLKKKEPEPVAPATEVDSDDDNVSF
jgi:hypothetical protein